MPELKSAYIGELMMEVTGSYMLGDAPVGRREPSAVFYDVFEVL